MTLLTGCPKQVADRRAVDPDRVWFACAFVRKNFKSAGSGEASAHLKATESKLGWGNSSSSLICPVDIAGGKIESDSLLAELPPPRIDTTPHRQAPPFSKPDFPSTKRGRPSRRSRKAWGRGSTRCARREDDGGDAVRTFRKSRLLDRTRRRGKGIKERRRGRVNIVIETCLLVRH